jgi:hypothetical protein
MRRRLLHRLPGIAVVACAVACSLVVDTAEIDRGCGPGKKACPQGCVSIDDPAFGCASAECSPCTEDDFVRFDDHHVAKCENGVCALGFCAFGFGCRGCLIPLLTDRANCGRCGDSCEADETCRRGVCVSPDDRGGADGAGGADG